MPQIASQRTKTVEGIVASLRDRRKSLGLKQAEVAGLCGLSVEGLSKIERGEAAPKLLTVLRLVEILGGRLEIAWPAAKASAGR